MATQNIGFDFFCPQAADRSYGALAAGKNIPYANAAAAIAAINAAYRYRGKTVLIDPGDGSGGYEYWWRTGTGDSQLVPKILHEQRTDFIIGDGGLYTPADRATAYTNPALVNAVITAVAIEGIEICPTLRTGYQYYTFNSTSGTVTLVNTKFALGSWYYIKYRQL